MKARLVPLLTWPVACVTGRRLSVQVVARGGMIELQFTGQRGGITPILVTTSDAFRLWGAICGRGDTITDTRWRASVSGGVVTRDKSGGLAVTELRVTRRYARRARVILLDDHARACLRAQIARAVLVATGYAKPVAGAGGVAGACDAAQGAVCLPMPRHPMPPGNAR